MLMGESDKIVGETLKKVGLFEMPSLSGAHAC